LIQRSTAVTTPILYITIATAYVIGDKIYLTLDEDLDQFTGSFSPLVTSSYQATDLPDGWSRIDAAFTNENGVNFWFNNELGLVYQSDRPDEDPKSIRTTFGLPDGATGPFTTLTSAAVFNDKLHVIDNDKYTVYSLGQSSSKQTDTKVKTVLETMFNGVDEEDEEVEISNFSDEQEDDTLAAIMVVEGCGLWTLSDH